MTDFGVFTSDEMEEILVQWAAGMTIPELAEQEGVSDSAMGKALKLYREQLPADHKFRQIRRQGVSNKPRPRPFTDDELAEMYEEWAEGATLDEIAERKGKGRTQVVDWLQRYEMSLAPADRLTEEERQKRMEKVLKRRKEAKRAAAKKRAQEALKALRESKGQKE